ncbi:MAG TPA: hypothetical protein VJV79_34655 [Polyangiaceae bacterium]|nr:hypothetical protein [Polyangiaceae bacterium]
MKAFKQRLEKALGSGAALALLSFPGCGGSAAHDGTPSAAGASGASTAGGPSQGGAPGAGAPGAGAPGAGAPSTGTAGQPAGSVAGAAGAAGQPEPAIAGAGGDSSQALSPYPVGSLGCSGPFYDSGFHGQCCGQALCYTPNAGSECVPPTEAPEKLDVGYGSGSCLCGDEIQGPFAANPAHEPEKPGTCCYVISSIGCDGRPLLVDGAPVVSALTQRGDWILADVLGLWA